MLLLLSLKNNTQCARRLHKYLVAQKKRLVNLQCRGGIFFGGVGFVGGESGFIALLSWIGFCYVEICKISQNRTRSCRYKACGRNLRSLKD